jgi:hypothetical protein
LRWKRIGYKVVTHYGTRNLPQADIVILHVDATVVSDDYVDPLSKYPVVLNGNVLNISKNIFSKNILSAGDKYSGRVIVKTNANYGGVPEMSRARFIYSKLTLKWNWERVAALDPNRYPIFENMESVSGGIWKNRNLIVEKFLPERTDTLFYVRYWMFLGDRGWAGRFGAKEPIVKFGRMVTRDESVDVPEELKALRKRLGFDYGRFDYVEHDGETVIYDVNKTVGGAHHLDAYSDQLDMLAEGIKGFDIVRNAGGG